MRGKRAGLRRLAWTFAALAAACVAAGAWVYLTLPDVTTLKSKNPPTTAFIQLRERQYREARKTIPRRQSWVPLRAISPHLVNAVLMAEDTAFYQHDGVDYHELWESVKLDWRHKRLSRGASTLTQQLARNLYLSPDRTALRKFRELLITRRLEEALEKRRILELYLNVAEWGRHIYGAEAAAQAYFHVRARDLTPEQSAVLAGMLINPIKYSPLTPSTRLAARKRIILGRMVRFGRLSKQEYRIAMGLQPPTPPVAMDLAVETVAVEAPPPSSPPDAGTGTTEPEEQDELYGADLEDLPDEEELAEMADEGAGPGDPEPTHPADGSPAPE